MNPGLHNILVVSCQAESAWRQFPFLPRGKASWAFAIPGVLAFVFGVLAHLDLVWSLVSTGQADGSDWLVAFLVGVPAWLVCLGLAGWSTIIPAWRSRLMFWCLGLSLASLMCWGFGLGLHWGLSLLA